MLHCTHVDPSNESAAKAANRFLHTCAKFNAWEMTDYSAVVLLDSDTLVLKPIYSLFHLARVTSFAAVPAPETGYAIRSGELYDEQWSFQTACLLLRPSRDMFEVLRNLPFELRSADHELEVLNALFISHYQQRPAMHLPYSTHVAQTALGSRVVPRHPSGSLELDQITMFDFSGPLQFKPWRVLHSISGLVGHCNELVTSHINTDSIDLSEYHVFRLMWIKFYVAACGHMLAVDPKLPILPLGV
eukprot:c19035_g1_i1.p1 GENE.c19035_g1_i1~~c19035_g1_i1.p1  ORF type:complete len:245 (+),score=42.25 c19035_g1_i1:428-1162(+)